MRPKWYSPVKRVVFIHAVDLISNSSPAGSPRSIAFSELTAVLIVSINKRKKANIIVTVRCACQLSAQNSIPTQMRMRSQDLNSSN